MMITGMMPGSKRKFQEFLRRGDPNRTNLKGDSVAHMLFALKQNELIPGLLRLPKINLFITNGAGENLVHIAARVGATEGLLHLFTELDGRYFGRARKREYDLLLKQRNAAGLLPYDIAIRERTFVAGILANKRAPHSDDTAWQIGMMLDKACREQQLRDTMAAEQLMLPLNLNSQAK